MIRIANAVAFLTIPFIIFHLTVSRASHLSVFAIHPDVSETGHWGPSVQVSLVTVAAAVLPPTGHVLLWAAYQADEFNGDGPNIDRTVMAIYDPQTGGGGLCWKKCEDNVASHLDVQDFPPPYSFESDRRLRSRPEILQVSDSAYHGEHIIVMTDTVISDFTMIRYSSVTHSINTDQRRVPLQLDLIKAWTSDENEWRYQAQIPQSSGIVTPGN
ncbi:Putative immunoglobulin-like, galactose oxidase-like, Early set domain-containing protein [Colletotrichum destructivum]|uniref:Immunoglobulin-like, galactose oxidase-like, Early set domain-containing protein n=1 Tax=Colletotrichum destructivum TaxID=34406 RepID=A0AAX4IXV8_9PEZI|nr:Putative immunoglobulin-like, galactose oxidase-like, Early set domain-containing protein [Colletotrichum destructivum]